MTTPNIRELRRQRARRHARWPLGIRLLIVLAGVYVLYVLAGFLIAPSIIKSKLEARLTDQLKRPVAIDRVGFNPITLSLTIERLRVKDHDDQLLVGWNRLFVNFQLFALFADEIHFAEIDLEGFAGRVHVSKNGVLNIADISAPSESSTSTSKKPWVLRIDRLSVTAAELDYSDESRAEPFHTHIGPTTFVLRQFRTSTSEGAPGVFTATTESGEHIEWSGRVALAPLRSTGELRLTELLLKKYAPYYSSAVGFDVADGTIDVQAPYEFFLQQNKPELKLSEASVAVHHLQLAEKGKTDPLVAVKSIDIGPIAADLQAATVDISRVVVESGKIDATRDEHGVNLFALAGTPAEQVRPGEPSSGGNGWKIKVTEVSGKDFVATLHDRTTPQAGDVGLTHLNFTVRHFSTDALNTALPIDVQADVSPGPGSIAIQGTAVAQPASGQLQFTADRVALAPLNPWIASFAHVRVTQGVANARLQTQFALGANSALKVSGSGDADVSDFAATDDQGAPLANWKSLLLHGVAFSAAPNRLTVADISLLNPHFDITRRRDQTLNVSTLLIPTVAAPRVTANVAPSTRTFMAIDRLTVVDGSADFTDDTVQPAVHTSAGQIAASITGLTSAEIDRADLQFNALVNGAPLSITGKVNLLSDELAADLRLNLKNSDLHPLAPYIGKFVGYELTSGEASVDARAKVGQQKLDSTTNLVISNFVLGTPTNSPDAPHVPVQLALALLRDPEGNIALNNLSVQGDLSDPHFAISNVVMHVIANVIVKAATSPFSLIGAMFGGGKSGEELSYVDFAAGSTEVSAPAQQKLDVLAKALHERPALHLTIVGAADAAQDATALREQELEQRIHTELTNPHREIAGPINPGMQIGGPLDPEAQAIATLYQKAFAPPAPIAAKPNVTPESTTHRFFLFRWFSSSHKETPAPKKPVTPVAATPPPPVILPSVSVMRERLLEKIQATPEQLQQLANARANEIRLYLIAHGPVDPDRIESATAKNDSIRTTLQLH